MSEPFGDDPPRNSADDLRQLVQQPITAKQAFGAVAREVEEKLVHPLREILKHASDHFKPLTDVLQAFSSISPEQRQAIALAFTAALTDWQRSFDEEAAKVKARLKRAGYPGLERYFTGLDMRELLQLDDSSNLDAIDEYVRNYFAREDFQALNTMCARWLDIGYLQERAQTIEDAVSAHMQRRFSLTIPTLFPFAEGLAAEIVGTSDTNVIKTAAAQWSGDGDEDLKEVFVDAVFDLLYRSSNFSTGVAPLLNRHWVLHGRMAHYGSEANSIRVFLLTDTLVEMAFEIRRVQSA